MPRQEPRKAGQPLSEDQANAVDAAFYAVTCMTSAPDLVPGDVAALVEASIADNTRRAYRSDLAHFAAWGGRAAGRAGAGGLLPRRAC